MATLVRELDKRIKGPMAETEDWWRLMRDDDGSLFVEHEWSHTNLNKLSTDADTARYSIDEFLESASPQASKAVAALQEMKANGEI